MPHDEWAKNLPDGRLAEFVYDEIAGVCSATITIGRLVRSHSNLKGPLTREEVEALFAREMQRVRAAP